MRAPGFPRKRPVDWAWVRRVLRFRQERVRLAKRGFKCIGGLHSQDWPYRITEVVVTEDGQNVWARMEQTL